MAIDPIELRNEQRGGTLAEPLTRTQARISVVFVYWPTSFSVAPFLAFPFVILPCCWFTGFDCFKSHYTTHGRWSSLLLLLVFVQVVIQDLNGSEKKSRKPMNEKLKMKTRKTTTNATKNGNKRGKRADMVEDAPGFYRQLYVLTKPTRYMVPWSHLYHFLINSVVTPSCGACCLYLMCFRSS